MNNNNIESARILIVDDTPKNIQVLGTILKQEGYQVNVARNGLEALKMVCKVFPDLILLDIIMPEMDGYDTCKTLKQAPETKDIPIIFLTAKTETEDIVKGFQAGGVDYISKPFNATELLARIHTHIDLWRKTKQLQEFADKDGLTMIANRRRFNEFLDSEWRRCLRSRTPLSLIMIDIDCFKSYNDYYGHQQGDDCLRLIAKTISSTIKRPGDMAARYGGEEFVVILGNTPAEAGNTLAEEIRLKIEYLNIPHTGSTVKNVVTSSIGVATIVPDRDISPAMLVSAADKKLYKAKNAGRNQVM
ncbi:MAG: PleD family two-component system response regulator [Desulfobacteraceae bacterium]|nr:PleD family two-component system response regulator [Desulfobacteraceae bacterium]